MKSKSPGAGKLSVVATPIGNLGDITLRAAETLRAADCIACEDTRVSRKLLSHLGISKPLLAYHDHNADMQRPKLLERIAAGEHIALISDAGTPLISDPGYKLVREAAEHGLMVETLPGPSALLAGLVLSGLPSDQFYFAGFLPTQASTRRALLAQLAPLTCTLVLFESVHRVADTLEDLHSQLGDRPCALARELTKLHEEVLRGSLLSVREALRARPALKGEVVLIIGGAAENASQPTAEALDAMIRSLLATHSVKSLAAELAEQTGMPRSAIYQRALALRKP